MLWSHGADAVRTSGDDRLLVRHLLTHTAGRASVPPRVALTDWDAVDSPVVRMMAHPAAARLPRVRATIDFLTDIFREIERRCLMLAGTRPSGKAPPWAGSAGYRKASVAASRGNR